MSTKLDLSAVTLMCADCVDDKRAIRAIERSKELCEFGAVLFFTSVETDYPHITIDPIRSLNDYSAFLLKQAWTYVKTPHVLTVQHDGWVLNAGAWDPRWLLCDYLGPLFLQEQVVDARSVGSGGFSLRSKALMQRVSELLPVRDGHCSYDRNDGKDNWAHEDGVIAKHLRYPLTSQGFKFGTPQEAGQFAFGGNQNFYCENSFGFHGFWPEVLRRLGVEKNEQLRLS